MASHLRGYQLDELPLPLLMWEVLARNKKKGKETGDISTRGKVRTQTLDYESGGPIGPEAHALDG